MATNSRASSPSTFSGNYWDGYEGYDLDHDGIGDVPFRPVRLFSVLVDQNEPLLILLRSLLLDLLEVAERVVPGAHARDAGGCPAPDAMEAVVTASLRASRFRCPAP